MIIYCQNQTNIQPRGKWGFHRFLRPLTSRVLFRHCCHVCGDVIPQPDDLAFCYDAVLHVGSTVTVNQIVSWRYVCISLTDSWHTQNINTASDWALLFHQMCEIIQIQVFPLTRVSLFPGQYVHPCAAEGAVSVGLGAVQHLLQRRISRFLGFDPHLRPRQLSKWVFYYVSDYHA